MSAYNWNGLDVNQFASLKLPSMVMYNMKSEGRNETVCAIEIDF